MFGGSCHVAKYNFVKYLNKKYHAEHSTLISSSLPLMPPEKHTHIHTYMHNPTYSPISLPEVTSIYSLVCMSCIYIYMCLCHNYTLSSLCEWDYTILLFHAFFHLKIHLGGLAKSICINLPLSFQQLNSILYYGWTILDFTQVPLDASWRHFSA